MEDGTSDISYNLTQMSRCLGPLARVAVAMLQMHYVFPNVFHIAVHERSQLLRQDMLTYYDSTCVYVANIQTWLKSLLVFVHSDVKNTFNHRNTFVYTNMATVLTTPTARGLLGPRHQLVGITGKNLYNP